MQRNGRLTVSVVHDFESCRRESCACLQGPFDSGDNLKLTANDN